MAIKKATSSEIKRASLVWFAVLFSLLVGLLCYWYLAAVTEGKYMREQLRHAISDRVQTACQAYYTEFGKYPVASDNVTLISILEGKNSRGIRFIDFGMYDLDAKGELLDPWGTPLQLSVTADGKLHARSAGPDKIFGTPDDITSQ